MASIYKTPTLQTEELEVLEIISEAHEQLRLYVNPEPRRWMGTLRRMSFARAVQASNTIEGYNASLDDVVAAVDHEPTLSADEETILAVNGYRDAMTYVLQVAQDTSARVDEGLLKSLHFMMLNHHLEKSPGRWREGPVFVVREGSGEQVYEGPTYDCIPTLITAMIGELEESQAPVLVRAAMAHLNLVMIHPFRDGNGRMARALQTLVLAREQIMAPVFSSIEEYLGRNTQSYYDVLASTGRGSWSPENDARNWIRFCMRAHYFQVRTQRRRIEETEQLYHLCGELTNRAHLPERTVGALVEAAFGFRLTHASYKAIVDLTAGEELSSLTASRDLRAMVDANLLRAIGQTRGRHYLSEPILTTQLDAVRAGRRPRETGDPFDLVADSRQLSLET